MIPKETVVYYGDTKLAVSVTEENGSLRARMVKFKCVADAFFQTIKAGHGFIYVPREAGENPVEQTKVANEN